MRSAQSAGEESSIVTFVQPSTPQHESWLAVRTPGRQDAAWGHGETGGESRRSGSIPRHHRGWQVARLDRPTRPTTEHLRRTSHHGTAREGASPARMGGGGFGFPRRVAEGGALADAGRRRVRACSGTRRRRRRC
jgi:hypothetical protein